ncbi:MAG: cation-transporting P-type ATPase [Clostridia bacterium]|nr:cation-transporting P-type ATPase [Clostridia bacterium]
MSSVTYLNKNGLTDQEAEASITKNGKNLITKKKRAGFFSQLFKNFNDPIIRILIGALIINAIVSLGHINIPETVGIATAITIATLVSTISEYSSSLAFDKLCLDSSTTHYSLKRGGEIKQISSDMIAIGDIILLSPGQKVPCDGYILSGEVTCNQSPLTGESKEARKHPYSLPNISTEGFTSDTDDADKLFGGSLICTGSCEMIAVRTGDNSLIGKLALDLQEDNRPSPLKKRLSDLAGSISYIGYVLAFMIAFAYLFNVFVIDSNMELSTIIEKLNDRSFLINQLLHAITVAVSVIVVAVPEGLPMMITVVLSSNMKKMLRHGVLVRKMVGIETAGNLNILFTDKTGTLTTGNMTVCGVHLSDSHYTSLQQLKKHKVIAETLIKCADCACGTGTVSSTEQAIIKFFLKKSKRCEATRSAFDPSLKYSKGIHLGNTYYIGAPEKLLSVISAAYRSDGTPYDLSDKEKKALESLHRSLSVQGSRVLCCIENNIFICFIAIRDPLRHDIRQAVHTVRNAGIQVMMITGDNAETAAAIAKEAGIIHGNVTAVLTSDKLKAMTDSELTASLSKIAVVARALPSDKIRLVRIAEKAGLVTGMTGDGINDAPALKASDVGFAMGSGTDIAKEAADIVITDDSFASITNAILYGRTIFESIRKFIVFQLTMNLCAMGVSLIGPFIGIENPVTVIQMLWVNIIMDTLGGLAFAGEPALRSYMTKSSRPLSEKILSSKMIVQILIGGGYSLALCIFFLISPSIRGFFEGKSDTYFLTSFFALLIFCGIFNSFNARTPKANILSHIAGNKGFIFIMSAVAVIQIMIIYFGGTVFRCVPLDTSALIFTGTLALTVIPVDMLRKIITKKGIK